VKYLQLIPIALELAKMAEAAVPTGGGKAKFKFAIDTAAEAFDVEESLRTGWGDKSQFIEAIGRAVNLVVNLLNATGVFKKAAPATV
jgi:hypothetical protein